MRTIAAHCSGVSSERRILLGECRRRSDETPLQRCDYRTVAVLGLLLGAFIGLQCLLPLGTAIKIGADEDYELSKATLCNHGYKLYTEIWNDQPPLVTFIIAGLLKHISSSVLAPRLLTVGLSLVLLCAVFGLIRSINGLLAAAIGTAMLIASPGFLELSCSVMQEIPALAPAVVALWVLWSGPKSKCRITEIIAGVVFGFALQMKMIGMVYLPIAGLLMLIRSSRGNQLDGAPRFPGLAQLTADTLAFAISVVSAFVALNYATGNSLLLEVRQSWAAHFSRAKSFEYGSPEQYPFDWSVLVKNWETTLPAILGITVLIRQARFRREAVVPIAWLALTLVVFSVHKPWWAYYYIHNAVPLCWCAGVGIAFLWDQLRVWANEQGMNESFRRTKHLPRQAAREALLRFCKGKWIAVSMAAILVISAAGWAFARVYLEVQAMQRAPKLFASLVLKEIDRYKPFTPLMFSDQPIYTFHADLPMPPRLAVLSLKRLWSGDMNSARLTAELNSAKPGLILLSNTSGDQPFQDLLNTEYRLVYQDIDHRLYALSTISKKPALDSL